MSECDDRFLWYSDYVNQHIFDDASWDDSHLSRAEPVARVTPDTVDLEALIKSGNYSTDYSSIVNSLSSASIPSKGFPSNISQFENKEAKLITTSTETGNINTLFNKLWITDISMQDIERVQITETFGDPIIKFFDKKTPVYGFSGLVLETGSTKPKVPGQYYWGSALYQYYENEIRGTKLAENKRLAVLHVANHAFFGFPLNLNIREVGSHNTETFAFSMVITKHEFIRDMSSMYNIEQYVPDANLERFHGIQEQLATETTEYNDHIKNIKESYADPQNLETQDLVKVSEQQLTESLATIKNLQTQLLALLTKKSIYDDS